MEISNRMATQEDSLENFMQFIIDPAISRIDIYSSKLVN